MHISRYRLAALIPVLAFLFCGCVKQSITNTFNTSGGGTNEIVIALSNSAMSMMSSMGGAATGGGPMDGAKTMVAKWPAEWKAVVEDYTDDEFTGVKIKTEFANAEMLTAQMTRFIKDNAKDDGADAGGSTDGGDGGDEGMASGGSSQSNPAAGTFQKFKAEQEGETLRVNCTIHVEKSQNNGSGSGSGPGMMPGGFEDDPMDNDPMGNEPGNGGMGPDDDGDGLQGGNPMGMMGGMVPQVTRTVSMPTITKISGGDGWNKQEGNTVTFTVPMMSPGDYEVSVEGSVKGGLPMMMIIIALLVVVMKK